MLYQSVSAVPRLVLHLFFHHLFLLCIYLLHPYDLPLFLYILLLLYHLYPYLRKLGLFYVVDLFIPDLFPVVCLLRPYVVVVVYLFLPYEVAIYLFSPYVVTVVPLASLLAFLEV